MAEFNKSDSTPNDSGMIKGREISNQKLYVHALDGLRGLAVLTVFMSHTSLSGHRALPFLNSAGTGKMGVFLFFILSSFLLTYPFLIKQEKSFERNALINFSYRRFFRIYPLFVLYLLVALGSSYVLPSVLNRPDAGIPFYVTPLEFLKHVFLQQGKGVTWSILVEFRYYFVLPLLAYLYAVLFRGHFWKSLLCTIALIGASQWALPQSEALNNDTRLLPYAPVMLTGTMLAVFQYNYKTKWTIPSWAPKVQEIFGLLSAGLLVLSVPSVWYLVMGGSEACFGTLDVFLDAECHKIFHHSFIETSLLWGLVLLGAVNGQGVLQRIFEWKPLRYVGWISFSFYLWHPCVLMVFRNVSLPVPAVVIFWLMLIITVLISHVSYRVVEVPSSKIKYKPK
jgi:peptidoglycan/LPS O-acetylase OafA/YrhL